jgi:two-component system, LytTR family, sensor kinase
MLKKNAQFKTIFTHLLCWLCYLSFTNFIYYTGTGETVFISSALHQGLVTLGIFYSNALLIAPKLIPSKKYFQAILSALLLIGIFTLLRYFLDFKILPIIHIKSAYTMPDKRFILDSIWFGLLYLLLSYGYWAALYNIRLEADNRKLEEQKRKAVEAQLAVEQENNRLEMVFLKMQIKPHFMHNLLSSVYTRVHKLSPESATILMSLTDLLRYTTQTSRFDEKVLLRDELENINTYLSLQQFRFGESFFHQFKTQGDADDLQVLPLILLSFIENAIKYGELSNPQTPLEIAVEINDTKLMFNCYNLKSYQGKANTYSSGVGLDNIKRRLEKVYPKNYQLVINESEIDYRVSLDINL